MTRPRSHGWQVAESELEPVPARPPATVLRPPQASYPSVCVRHFQAWREGHAACSVFSRLRDLEHTQTPANIRRGLRILRKPPAALGRLWADLCPRELIFTVCPWRQSKGFSPPTGSGGDAVKGVGPGAQAVAGGGTLHFRRGLLYLPNFVPIAF